MFLFHLIQDLIDEKNEQITTLGGWTDQDLWGRNGSEMADTESRELKNATWLPEMG